MFRGEHINFLAWLTLGQPAICPRAIWTLTRAKSLCLCAFSSPQTERKLPRCGILCRRWPRLWRAHIPSSTFKRASWQHQCYLMQLPWLQLTQIIHFSVATHESTMSLHMICIQFQHYCTSPQYIDHVNKHREDVLTAPWEFGEGVDSARGVAAIVVCRRNSWCNSSCDAIARNGRRTIALFLLFRVQ